MTACSVPYVPRSSVSSNAGARAPGCCSAATIVPTSNSSANARSECELRRDRKKSEDERDPDDVLDDADSLARDQLGGEGQRRHDQQPSPYDVADRHATRITQALISVSAAPMQRKTRPTARGQAIAMRARPNQPKRAIAAAMPRLRAMIVPIVAARPMRGDATVMARMISTESAPPVHSHSGSRATSARPWKLCVTIKRRLRPRTTETTPEKASAGKTPVRSPSSPITAA